MKNYWCEKCNYRWKEELALQCPNCGEVHDVRVTMSEEEAEEKGLK